MVHAQRTLEGRTPERPRVLRVERRGPNALKQLEVVDVLGYLVRHAVVEAVGDELVVEERGAIVTEVRSLPADLHRMAADEVRRRRTIVRDKHPRGAPA